jgi:dihydrofolate reductase
MRLVATEYLSLDGVFEEPGHWSGPFFSDEARRFKSDELQASDALLLGRKTYEGFAAAWPTMKGTGEFGEKMNTMTKYVVSSTLKSADWPGSKVVKGNLAEEIRRLKREPGHDLLLSGSWCTRSCLGGESAFLPRVMTAECSIWLRPRGSARAS